MKEKTKEEHECDPDEIEWDSEPDFLASEVYFEGRCSSCGKNTSASTHTREFGIPKRRTMLPSDGHGSQFEGVIAGEVNTMENVSQTFKRENVPK